MATWHAFGECRTVRWHRIAPKISAGGQGGVSSSNPCVYDSAGGENFKRISICSGIQSGRAGSRSQRHPDRIGDLKFMAGEISFQEGADPLSGGSETLK